MRSPCRAHQCRVIYSSVEGVGLQRGFPQERKLDVLTGGLVRLGIDGIFNAIDFAICHRVIDHVFYIPPHVNPGLFKCEGPVLTLCFADSGVEDRPSRFGSTETPNQSLAVYDREMVLD